MEERHPESGLVLVLLRALILSLNCVVLESIRVVSEGHSGCVCPFERVEFDVWLADPFICFHDWVGLHFEDILCQGDCVLVSVVQVLSRVEVPRDLGCHDLTLVRDTLTDCFVGGSDPQLETEESLSDALTLDLHGIGVWTE